ncbi:heavy-metal-associated domain-containing protein [Erythrobacter sp. SDW2]|uniref:heavy-metal-associated domain-containing protein n=1 Tax=Erythrobacter sp. SDW2 TaxID=2907154 RepID=UPI001F19569A|nr:heavy-metal-associated domain-containing protein [Erythrobacter sp. SDW2]UIP07937.1 heavy-metal-associated domain-containing protein [Erythrobacter sp. SDW2]
MALNALLPRPQGLLAATPARLAVLAFVVAFLAGLGLAIAQVDGERGIPVISASSDIDVAGIKVDVTADSDEEARRKGWQEAVRKGWEKLGGPKLADGQLLSLVSAVVIENEQLGGNRYIATLGVTFDRQRAGGYLGGLAQKARSGPMLLIPVTMSGGSAMVYEQRNPWQRAWAEYQSGTSRIDYVRPSGAGSDSLLVTYGQTGRHSRAWWNTVLDQFGAADILVPIAELHYQYPGGPVQGEFTARYGPDNAYLDSFTMTAASPDELPQMLSKAVLQFDQIFTKALEEGKLRPDPTLSRSGIEVSPIIQRLIEASRAAQAAETAAASGSEASTDASSPTPAPSTSVVTASGTYVVQFATPDGGSFDATLSGVRAIPGVRGVGVSSTAIGGTSVMQVTFAGTLDQLAAALRARGFNVTQGSNALRISR